MNFEILLILFAPSLLYYCKVGQAAKVNSTCTADYLKKGDFYIGGFGVPVYASSNPRSCDVDYVPRLDAEWVDACVYAIEKMNKINFLGNITIGFDIVNTCGEAQVAIDVATNYVTNKQKRDKAALDGKVVEVAEIGEEICEKYRQLDVVAVLGPFYSSESVLVAPLLSYHQIPLVSMTATSDALSDKKKYPYFSRVIAPDKYQAEALIRFARHYDWTYISIVYQSDNYGLNGLKQLQHFSTKYDICIAQAVTATHSEPDENKFYEDLAKQLLKTKEARVIVVFVFRKVLPMLLTAIEKLGYLDYFVILGSEASYYPAENERAASGMFLTIPPVKVIPDFYDYYVKLNPLDNPSPWFRIMWEGLFKCTFDREKVAEQIPYCNENATLADLSTYSQSVWDAYSTNSVYAILHGVKNLITEKCPTAFNETSEFRRKDILKNCLKGPDLLKAIRNVEFEGEFGLLKFDKNGDVVSNIWILQSQADPTRDINKMTKVAELFGAGGKFNVNEKVDMSNKFKRNEYEQNYSTIESICSRPCNLYEIYLPKILKCCWDCKSCRDNEITIENQTKCQECPMYEWPDQQEFTRCQPIVLTHIKLNDTVAIVLIIIAGTFLVLTISLLSTVVKNYRKKIIKASSRELMFVIIAGDLVACINVIIICTEPSTAICAIQRILFNLSATAVYAALTIKIIRVYRIFTASAKGNRQVKYTSSHSQLVLVLILLLIQAIIIIVTFVVDKSEAALFQPVRTKNYVELLCSVSLSGFIPPLVYNIILILVCSFFGFMTRKLPDNFNESWYVFLVACMTFFMYILFLPGYFVATSAYQRSILLGLACILNVIINVVCLFMPKIYALYFIDEFGVDSVTAMMASTSRTKSTMATSRKVAPGN